MSPNGIFDTLYDAEGNKFALQNLALESPKKYNGDNIVNAPPTASCQAGIFIAYFDPGSCFTQTPALQTVACELLNNFSGLVGSTTGTGSIKIFFTDLPVTSPALATGTSLFLFPFLPANPNQGVIQSVLQKAIISGVDPYSFIPANVFANGSGFYHAIINVKSTVNWNTNLSTTTIGSGQYDLYSALVHEMLHLLGFTSLITANGSSALTGCYSPYDKFLHDAAGNPLLTNSSTVCTSPYDNLVYTAAATAINPGACTNASTTVNLTTCSVAAQYSSTNVNVKVYTPNCFEDKASLSHFEDMCTTPSFTPVNQTTCTPSPASPGYNDLYFCVSSAGIPGSCYVKRYPQKEERCVLADMGFSLNTTYTSTAVFNGSLSTYTNGVSTYSYPAGCASTPQIIGTNDGIFNGNYTLTTSSNSIVITYSSQVLNNDLPGSGLEVSCLSLIYNNATFTAGVNDFTVNASPGSGLVVLKYYPKNSSGVFGNATYIFVYFLSASCNAVNVCNMVQNGGFENTTNQLCGDIDGTNTAACWDDYLYTPILWTTNSCYFQLGTVVQGILVNTFNQAANNANCAQLIYDANPLQYQCDAVLNPLGSPLVSANSYELSFWGMNLGAVPTSTAVNPANYPTVITVASHPGAAFTATLPYPSGLHVIHEFTINASNTWALYTHTFVYGAPNNGNTLLIGIDPVKTSALGTYTGSMPAYRNFFIDEVSLQPLSAPVFTLPVACTVPTYTDLSQFASVAGTFTGTGVTFSGGTYKFNASGTLTPGSYPVSFSYTNGPCTYTTWQNVTIPGLQTGPCNAGYTLTAYGYSNSPTYTWLPGGSNAATFAVTPSVATTYTLIVNTGTICSVTHTVSLSPCCPSSTTAYGSSILSGTVTGPVSINQNLTIPSGTTAMLTGEVKIAPDVQITVNGGGYLVLHNAHLYSCGTAMWKGIVVQDGGALAAGAYNLVEDAKTAIDVSNNTTSTVSILQVQETTFNKNYIDIKVDNFQRTLTTYPFIIDNCVFTCRDFTYTTTSWPTTATSTSLDLRYVSPSTPTTGLASPYPLLGAATATLKAPYSTMSSSVAILLNKVGVTTYTSANYNGALFKGITIGDQTHAPDFNLFDNHHQFIHMVNSNLFCYNNVFQNTVRTNSQGGSAIYSRIGIPVTYDPYFNNIINLNTFTNSDVNKANRFWNCHIGVEANNTFSLNAAWAIFRSTQSTTAGINNPDKQGFMGIKAITNRYAQYYLYRMEMNNISNPVKVNLVPGPYSDGTNNSNGILAGDLLVYNSYFGAALNNTASIGTNFVNRVVDVQASVGPNWKFWGGTGIDIDNNAMNRVYNGVHINGVKTTNCFVAGNEIVLKEQAAMPADQRGIALSNCTVTTVRNNTVSAETMTHTTVNLLRSAYNSAPSIRCNQARTGYRGFVFENANPGTFWRGNTMNDLQGGMVLTSSALIGTQGATLNPSDNQWLGSNWNSTSYGLLTESGSNAGSSILYVKSSGAYDPNNANLANVPYPFSYAFPGNVVPTTGTYVCANTSGVGGGWDSYPRNIAVPIEDGEYTPGQFFTARSGLFRYLQSNSWVRDSVPELADFYDSMSGSEEEALFEVEGLLYEGNFTAARGIMGDIEPDPANNVALNCKEFYRLYADYLESVYDGAVYSGSDSTDLYDLAHLCPGKEGACIYQARALYELLYPGRVNYLDGCDEEGSRPASGSNDENQRNGLLLSQINEMILYPNPAKEELFILNPNEEEALSVTIKDMCNRIIFTGIVLIHEHLGKTDLDLVNGIYLVTIVNEKNISVTRKLVVAK